jgi:hypothetical protein
VADEHAGPLLALAKQVEKVDRAQADRDRLIVETAKANVPVPRIAAAVGLSRARIYQIIAEQSA